MKKASITFKHRQLTTMILLVLLVLGMIGGGFYLRANPITRQAQAISQQEQEAAAIQADAEAALARLDAAAPAQARALSEAQSGQRVEIVFDGATDEETTQQILTLLRQYGVPATFYFTSDTAQKQQASLLAISAAGYTVGLAADSSMSADKTRKELVELLSAEGYRMEAATGMRPTSLLYRQGAPTDSLLKAAGACYFTEVVVPAQSVGAQTFTSAEEAAALVGDMKKQEILCIRLTAVRSQMAHVTEWVLQAMAAGNLGSQAQRLVEANAGALSEPLTRVYTTEEAVGYTFTGLGNDVELMNLLSSLKALSAKCVFFVSPAEIEGSEGSIRQIQQAGHDLGLCVNAADYASADKLLETLLEARDALQKNYGCTDVSLVSQSYGAPGDLLKEAASAGGFTLVSYTIDAVRSSDQRATDASAVIAALFGNDTSKLQRGMIIHFQMNQYSQSNTLLGELARTLSAQRSLYALHSVADMLANRDLTYSYPLTEGQILPQLYNRIHPGQLSGSVIQAIQQRYIGTDWVDSKKMLPGFTSEEIKTLDKTGIIKNNSNQVFLTFDDWGSDEAINDILKVLKAHNAKATFFVRTGNVHYNPNLLRAIAMEGHAIASHTDSHFALSNDTTGAGKVFSSLTTAQVAALQTDLVKSWEVLQSIVGDIIVDGKPALTLLFRPPTLAVSKEGLQTVLDCGFTYSVSGFYSSQDYKAKSPEKLASGLASNTKSGSILVMHMSDNSVYTADALELYLTKMELRPVSKQYRFVRLDEAL